MLGTIVVGVDFSSASEPAIAQARTLAMRHNANVVLVHASGLTDATMAMHDEAIRTGAPWKDYVDSRTKRARQLLQETAERCRESGLHVLSRLNHGFPDATIVATAHDVSADLVVVGTHNRKGEERWLLGSVSERVVRMCERHVLVAKSGPLQGDALERVLVATDFTDTAERALAVALSLASPTTEVEVVHCWQAPRHYGEQPPSALKERLRERACEQGNALLAQHSSRVRSLRFELVEARPAAGILSRLDTGAHDLVVVGSHGRRGVRRLILGSVAEEVVRAASQSVLVVHASP